MKLDYYPITIPLISKQRTHTTTIEKIQAIPRLIFASTKAKLTAILVRSCQDPRFVGWYRELPLARVVVENREIQALQTVLRSLMAIATQTWFQSKDMENLHVYDICQ